MGNLGQFWGRIINKVINGEEGSNGACCDACLGAARELIKDMECEKG